ncbi:hypothetical protein SNEBB_006485 [Seison nebaliae]|nr:hypothetical protein SNEBB_006485 [Seison nebaliae]
MEDEMKKLFKFFSDTEILPIDNAQLRPLEKPDLNTNRGGEQMAKLTPISSTPKLHHVSSGKCIMKKEQSLKKSRNKNKEKCKIRILEKRSHSLTQEKNVNKSLATDNIQIVMSNSMMNKDDLLIMKKETRTNKQKRRPSMPNRILLDLRNNFINILNLEQLSDPNNIFFALERAHWFYVDNYVRNNSIQQEMKSSSKRQLFQRILMANLAGFPNNRSAIEHVLNNFHELYSDWKNYVSRIPRVGVVLIDKSKSKVLLVSGYHKRSWHFPRGKLNEGENQFNCAIREVEEEIGINVREYCNEDRYIEALQENQMTPIRLYVAQDVPQHKKYVAKFKQEIAKIKWFPFRQVLEDKYNEFPLCMKYLDDLKKYFNVEKTEENNEICDNSMEEKMENTVDHLSSSDDELPIDIKPDESILGLVESLIRFRNNRSPFLGATTQFTHDNKRSEKLQLIHTPNIWKSIIGKSC